MSQKEMDYAKKADAAVHARDFKRAEEFYLLAAAQLATSKQSQDVKNRKLYDAAAKRCRRLAVIEAAKP